MSIIRAQVELPRDSGIPADVTVNSWSFLTTASPPPLADLAQIHQQLTGFYQAIDEGVLSTVIGPQVTVKYYDLGDPKPRVPLLMDNFAIAPAAAGIPTECAIVLSFQGAKTSGANMKRRRGRIYLGPIGNNTVLSANGRVYISPAAAQVVQNAADVLLTQSLAAASWEWAVYSPTDNAAIAVRSGWVDDAFDTIRSRGERPQLRRTFPV